MASSSCSHRAANHIEREKEIDVSEEKSQRAVCVPVWGILLLFLGIIFLLQSFNVLPWDLWVILWRFWPVLIIIIGLCILLRSYNVWLVTLLVLVLLGACLGIAIWQYGASPLVGVTTKNYSQPMGNLQSAQIDIDFTAGSLTMGSLSSDSLNLVEAEYEVRNGEASMKAEFQQQDKEGQLSLDTEHLTQRFWDKGGINWVLNFTSRIPLLVNIKSDASNVDLVLSELEITEFRLDIDASNCKVTMPSSAGITSVYIKADVANVEITIPEGVAARIKVDRGLSALDVDESRFPKKGDYYVSPNFEGATNRIELELDSDVGRVEVK